MTAALSTLGNDRIKPGGNNPPAFDAHSANIQGIREEAGAWLDGGKITSAAEAEAVDLLLDMARKAGKAADEARTEEKEPHLKAGREVDAKWKPLITSATTIADVCKLVLAPWRIAEKARKDAAAALVKAQAEAEIEAFKAARNTNDGSIEAAEQIEQFEASTKLAQKAVKLAEKAADTGNGLVPHRTLKVTDARALAGWLWKFRREEVEAAHAELAQSLFRASTRGQGGASEMDGTEIITEMKAR